MAWKRSGDFLFSGDGRYAIHRTLLSHGHSYALYDCDPKTDWAPIELLCVKDQAAKCKKWLEEND